MPIEEMGSFFNARVDEYEQHIIQALDGTGGYIEVARLVPAVKGTKLLDLGCGTGLELDEIFKVNPMVRVTGIDLAEKMLEKLRQKHADKKDQLSLIAADYFSYDFGINTYDVVLSVESLHHYTHDEKRDLYKRLLRSLSQTGFYIELDYYAPTQEFEDLHFTEKERICSEQEITSGRYHLDTPCTVANQVMLLKEAGFTTVDIVRQREKSAILVAKR